LVIGGAISIVLPHLTATLANTLYSASATLMIFAVLTLVLGGYLSFEGLALVAIGAQGQERETSASGHQWALAPADHIDPQTIARVAIRLPFSWQNPYDRGIHSA
jgi:hypothetical protein